MTELRIVPPHPCGDCKYVGMVQVSEVFPSTMRHVPGRAVMLYICSFYEPLLIGASGRCGRYLKRIVHINSPTVVKEEHLV